MNYSFKVPCCKDKLQSIRDFIYNTLQHYDISDVELNQMVLAVDEVCANLMIHSHQCNPKDSLELAIEVKDNKGVIFEIRDKGAGFNFKNYKEPCIEQIIKEKRKGGIGLLLVKRIMDQIEFSYNAKTSRNIYRLHKFINIQQHNHPQPPRK